MSGEDDGGSGVEQVTIRRYYVIFIFIGLFLLFISPVLAFAAYSPQRVIIGIGNGNIRDTIDEITEEDWKPEFYDYNLYYNIDQTKAYAGFIRDNQDTQFRKSGLFLLSILFLIFGTGAFMLGYLLLFGFSILNFVYYIILLSLIVIGIFAWTGATVLRGLTQMAFNLLFHKK